MTEESSLYFEFKVRGLAMDAKSKSPILLLEAHGAGLLLPIRVGGFEAAAIVVALEERSLNRPMTHDLMANLVQAMDAELLSADIASLSESTFFANLRLKTHGGEIRHIDCRPSDAVALAIRLNVVIRVESAVLEAAQPLPEDDDKTNEAGIVFVADDDQAGRARLLAELESMTPDDFGDFEM